MSKVPVIVREEERRAGEREREKTDRLLYLMLRE